MWSVYLPRSQTDKKWYVYEFLVKLDGVGPVDSRPSTDKLHHFKVKNKKIKNDF